MEAGNVSLCWQGLLAETHISTLRTRFFREAHAGKPESPRKGKKSQDQRTGTQKEPSNAQNHNPETSLAGRGARILAGCDPNSERDTRKGKRAAEKKKRVDGAKRVD